MSVLMNKAVIRLALRGKIKPPKPTDQELHRNVGVKTANRASAIVAQGDRDQRAKAAIQRSPDYTRKTVRKARKAADEAVTQPMADLRMTQAMRRAELPLNSQNIGKRQDVAQALADAGYDAERAAAIAELCAVDPDSVDNAREVHCGTANDLAKIEEEQLRIMREANEAAHLELAGDTLPNYWHPLPVFTRFNGLKLESTRLPRWAGWTSDKRAAPDRVSRKGSAYINGEFRTLDWLVDKRVQRKAHRRAYLARRFHGIEWVWDSRNGRVRGKRSAMREYEKAQREALFGGDATQESLMDLVARFNPART